MKTRSIVTGLIALFLIVGTTTLKAEKDKRKVDDFTKVAFAVAGHVEITIGDKYSVVLEADDDVLKKIKTEVEGSTLKIRKERGTRLKKKVNVFITMPNLESAVVSGSGTIETNGKVVADNFKAVLSGSGNILVDDLKADGATAVISGSGDIKFEGEVDQTSLTISGSGGISTEELECKDAKVVISGSGSAKVNASDNLKSVISGSGSVYYKGNPTIDAKSVGSGRIRSL